MRLFLSAVLLLTAACGTEPAPSSEPPSSEPPSSELPSPAAEEPVEIEPPPSLPPVVAGEPLYPETLVRLVEGDPRDARQLADVAACESCHPDVVEAWSASPHARASFDNPWYRQAVDSIREQRSPEASRFCAGCHDPVLLLADAMEEPIEPEDPRAHAGVTCLVCHGTQEARPDGSGSYTLRTAEVLLPDPADPEEIAAHVAELTPEPLRTSALCGSCHRGFLGTHMGNPHHLPGIDDLTAWGRSGYSGSSATRVDEPVEQATCQGCHMPMVEGSEHDFATTDGEIHSHRVPGGHTAMAAATGDDVQLAAVRDGLADVTRIDVAAVSSGGRSTRPADGARLRPGRVVLDVVMRNLGVGHRFPGGTRDAQDTWIEVEVRDAEGVLIAEAGTRHAESEDDTAHRLVAALVDEHAEVREMHRVDTFRAALYDRTLGPRNAEVVRYAFDLDASAREPLSIDARLRHRRHTFALHAAACESQSTERGRAFDAASEALGRAPIDACADQPITQLANARVWVGRGSEEREALGGATAPTWRRLFDHALGLIGDVQEHLDDARPSLSSGLRAAPNDHARAMFHAQRARLEGRQGRLRAALAAANRAQRLIGDHPAIHRVRGDAYAQVWRWEEAAESYGLAAEGAPGDDARWVSLARARGSAGDDEGALDAAVQGLALQPRSEAMLRSHYLALTHLELDGADAARERYLAHRVPDDLQALRLSCGQRSDACARERLPVHVHEMRTP